MPAPFWIIDAYNLMHALGMARKRYGPRGLERTRRRFINHLKNRLTEEERERTTVVFDAHDAPADAVLESREEGLTLIFAPPGGDADTQIEELIRRHSAPKQIQVVSSDRRLQRAARRRKGGHIVSEAYAAWLAERDPVARRRTESSAATEVPEAKFTGESPELETQRWLEEFGEIPEAEKLKSDPSLEPTPLEPPAAPLDAQTEAHEEDATDWMEKLAREIEAEIEREGW